MDLIRSAITKTKQVQKAIDELALTLYIKTALVLFFASTAYSFEELVTCFAKNIQKAKLLV